MDYLSLIKKPIENDLNDFIELFNRNLSHDDGLLSSALTHIRQRGGKRMRPMLILLTAKNYGAISDVNNSRIFRIRSLVRRFTIRSSTRRLQLSSRLALPLALSLQGLLMKILKRLLNLVEKASKFGQTLGIMFQIRDDIFDYYDSKEIGKPTGNDMAEGKLTLPVIYALNNTDFESMHTLARKVKAGTINPDEIGHVR